MKKLLPVLLLIVLLVSACNLPQKDDLSQDPVVQTRVAVILTQGAPSDDLPVNATEPSSMEAPDPEAEITAIIPDDIPEEEPAVITPLPVEPTAAPTEEPVTPTAIQPEAGDPWSGTPDFIDEFDAGTYWDFEGDYLLSKVSSGKLDFISKGTPWWSSWYTTYPAVKDGYFETTFTSPNCSGKDRFGLVIRWDESQEFYFMGVTCDGTWGFSRYTKDHTIHNIIEYQSSTALKPIAETNRIGILAKGNQFEFFINTINVGSTTDDNLPNPGTFGFVSMSAGTLNFKTSIEKLEYWEQ